MFIAESLPAGFINAVRLILRLKEGGLVVGGPPCSSFVFGNRACNKRTREQPLGAERQHTYVLNANRKPVGM